MKTALPMKTLAVSAWLALLPLAITFAACATTSANKPAEEKSESQPTANAADGGTSSDAGATASASDGGNEEIVDIHEASDTREREEKELAAKKAEDAENQARLKAAETKLNLIFGDAFKSIKQGQDDAALAKYQEVIKQQPEAFAAHYNMGVIYERKGLREEAIKEYQQALKLKADFDPASDNLSRLYLRAGQSDKAESELRQRILAYPRRLAFRNQLVRVMMAEGRIDQAESDSKKILKIDERNVDAMLNLALIWYGQKKYELAKQVLEAALEIMDRQSKDSSTHEIDPYAPAVWNLLAFTQLNLDQRSLALESFRKASELRPDYPEAHSNYGAMLNDVNDCDGATRELELAVRYAPDYAEAHANLGNAYRCAHKYKEAQAEYDKALALNTKSTDPIFNTAILYLDGFDMKVPFDTANPLDSEKLQRLTTAIKYFDKYKEAGGADDRFDRYYQDAQKGLAAEEKRLSRVKESAAKAEEHKKRDEEKKRIADEKEKALAAKNKVWLDQYRVAGKADIEEDAVAPTPAPPQAPVPVPKPEAAPTPAAPPPAAPAKQTQEQKLVPKEEM